LISLVGAGRFELPTPCSRSKCATRLRYAPPDLDIHRRQGAGGECGYIPVAPGVGKQWSGRRRPPLRWPDNPAAEESGRGRPRRPPSRFADPVITVAAMISFAVGTALRLTFLLLRSRTSPTPAAAHRERGYCRRGNGLAEHRHCRCGDGRAHQQHGPEIYLAPTQLSRRLRRSRSLVRTRAPPAGVTASLAGRTQVLPYVPGLVGVRRAGRRRSAVPRRSHSSTGRCTRNRWPWPPPPARPGAAAGSARARSCPCRATGWPCRSRPARWR
jgi:hypothetical protein